MGSPQIKGYTIEAEIGSGSAGVVYLAIQNKGSRCALKVFNSMSSNPGLMSDRMARVFKAGAQDVIVPILAKELEARPAWVAMELLANDGEDENPLTAKTLQFSFKRYLENDSTYPFLQSLASALAKLHSASVAHGNLKPGNIFLGQDGRPLLADFASGLMPGVHRLTFSDALLYSPPEQLRSRNGYEGEAGYRWDVYAFGVLAYRLLNGAFPRADKLFQWLCPSPGENQRLDIDADHEGIAEGLEQQGEVLWPHEAACEKERAFRKVIDSCLELDPRMRPLNMREVAQKFEVIEVESAQKEERDRLETLKKEAEQRCRGFSNRFRTASVVALILSLAWGGAQFLRVEDAKSKLFDYRKSVEVKEKEWADQRNAVIQSEGEAIVAKEIIEKALAQEKSLARDVIGSAQKTNEKLFDWLLEEGVDGLPVLEARITRLEFLIKEVGKQLEFVSGSPELAPQARVLKLRRAELGLAMGDLAKGEAWLKEAIGDPKLPSDLAAKAKLRYLLLASKLKPSSLKEDLSEIEVEILSHYGGGGSAEIRVKAALSLVKARVAESNGDNSAALAGYHESLRSFQDLEKLHPANTNIGFMIGRSYLSAAVIAEEERASGNAAKLRGEAAAAFASLAEKKANSTPETQYQIASAIASQALSLWQQGDSFGAEKLAREGVTRLIALQRKMPGDARIAIDLAAQQGIIATTLRDEGKSIEARRLLMEGITLIKNGVTEYTDNFSARYLLASLKWQLSGILGQQGDVNEENRLVMEAHDELRALLGNPTMERPRPSEVRKSLAYLCGDLGHASELGRKREEAIGHFQECKRLWQELKRDEGNQLEVEEGYQWAVNRLAEMGVK
tara:strand:+ start:10569 stop:13115 length:2547 start_codon:yes stop_codon:yes gene_type:complete